MVPDGLRLSHEADPTPEFRAQLGRAMEDLLVRRCPATTRASLSGCTTLVTRLSAV